MTGRDIYDQITDATLVQVMISDKLSQTTSQGHIMLTYDEANKVKNICTMCLSFIFKREFK